MVIGITGGIGAGKSVVSRILRCKGHTVYDCDSEAKALMDASEILKREISRRLGVQCILEDGSLNRREIAACVFSDSSHREWLNGKVHSMVRIDIERRIAQEFAESGEGSIFFVESAIMKTGGLDALCDAIWVVDAPEDLRLQRACSRDGADAEHVMNRINTQRDELTGFSCPIEQIENDGADSILLQINKLLKTL